MPDTFEVTINGKSVLYDKRQTQPPDFEAVLKSLMEFLRSEAIDPGYDEERWGRLVASNELAVAEKATGISVYG